MDMLISCPITKIKVRDSERSSYRIRISGLKGGHSGDDISKGRGNANKIMARLLWKAIRYMNYDILISSLNGGNLRNAIPREAWVEILIKNSKVNSFREFLAKFEKMIYSELQPIENEFSIELEECSKPASYIPNETIVPLVNSLHACPNGVISMSRTIPDFVETSTNMASIRTLDDRIEIVTSQRSSVQSVKKDIANRVRSQFELIGAQVKHTGNYPGWEPDQNSALLKITIEQYDRLFQSKPIVRAIHAGLECGLFLEKYPYLDMVSFGPTIKDAHSPDEKMKFETVQKFWDLLLAVMQNIPEI